MGYLCMTHDSSVEAASPFSGGYPLPEGEKGGSYWVANRPKGFQGMTRPADRNVKGPSESSGKKSRAIVAPLLFSTTGTD